jgi:hypothetical protein
MQCLPLFAIINQYPDGILVLPDTTPVLVLNLQRSLPGGKANALALSQVK